MENIEDTRQDPRELGEADHITPIYHWSEIHSPRFNNLTIDILNDDITLTQKVNIKNETPKTYPQRPAFVIYDAQFLEYKLLEVIAPIICDLRAKSQEFDALDDLCSQLTFRLTQAIFTSVRHHDSAIESCADLGIDLPFTSKFLLRSFKLAESRSF